MRKSKSKKNEHGNYLFEGNNPSIPSVYHRLNSRTYPLNDLDLSFIRENINYSCKIDCELALKKNDGMFITAAPFRLWRGRATIWKFLTNARHKRVVHQLRSTVFTIDESSARDSLGPTNKSMVNSVSRLSSLTSFPMRSSIMSRAQSASTDSRSVFDRFGTRTAIFSLFERFDYLLEIRYSSFYYRIDIIPEKHFSSSLLLSFRIRYSNLIFIFSFNFFFFFNVEWIVSEIHKE